MRNEKMKKIWEDEEDMRNTKMKQIWEDEEDMRNAKCENEEDMRIWRRYEKRKRYEK